MIQSGFAYLAMLLFIIAVVVRLDRRFPKFFGVVPGIVVIYFVVMMCSTFGLWKITEEVSLYHKHVKDNLLPVMIFLMLLRCDLRRIIKLGPRMLLGFFAATLTICLGFIIVYAVFRSQWEPHTWKTFAALCGSWIGGTGNMAAVQAVLGVNDSQMGYTLLMDSVNYSVWVMLLLLAVPHARHFNAWTKADTKTLDEIGAQLAAEKEEQHSAIEFPHLMLLIGVSAAAAAVSRHYGTVASATIEGFLNSAGWETLVKTSFFSVSTCSVMLITLVGTLAALTPLGKTPGISPLASISLYTIVALMGSKANFAELGKAPLYIFCGFLIILIHAVLLALIARFFRLDLFTCGVASLANIGGVASAPILAAAYSEVLIPIGVLMSMLGYIVGTGAALLVGQIMSAL